VARYLDIAQIKAEAAGLRTCGSEGIKSTSWDKEGASAAWKGRGEINRGETSKPRSYRITQKKTGKQYANRD